ncbi:serine/threonine protein kinase [Streptomyces cyaneochromogenes]|uniref:Serine/threonine protein kinase n=1 Tax=Streptomyces cyaneochromogenes TaxID=2496836 RepID=A0A3Q9ETP6_9ACTN|nr:serine/threonine-protein kinase [Streptomyces cyaneochromogenes]AZQ35753.1 serine/threonine protein kinase [Streptomyces cyaneochromogenes]
MDALRDRDPAHIGAYTLLARLGAGGMGQVYLARSPGGRLVAIKVIRDEITDHPEALARFRREVETVRAVRSAYTANLIDASLDVAPYWLATEYVSGPTLGKAVGERGALPAETCRGVLAALAEGLAAVHAHGVTHRDLKPQNVILATQGPSLIDFGIARGAGQTALTEAGFAPGTPGFTAPEVLIRNEVGPAADVFALGATLAYAATGRPPFGMGEPAGVSYRAVHEPIDLAGVEPELAALVEACVAKDPAERPGLGEVIARCGVRAALVEDPFYAGLAQLAEAVPQTPPTGQAGATVPVPPAHPPLGAHELPTAGAPNGYGYTPTQVSGPTQAVRRRRIAPWRVAVAMAVAVGVAYVLMAPDDDKGGGSAAGGDRSPGPSSSAASKEAPAYAGDKLDRTLWYSDTGECQLPPEERAGNGFMGSISDADDPDAGTETLTLDGKVRIGFRDKYATEGKAPYYVTVSVKPPHDIDPSTGKPVEGLLADNANVGYTSKPVDVYGGSNPGDWKYVTYPDDFNSWVRGKPSPAIPLTNDPGDWTVQFHHIRTPDDYSSVFCRGFTVK